MVTGSYTPERGDLVWVTFNPQSGREQAGRRPGVVLSPAFYNSASGLALVCPITSKAKGYPFEVALPSTGSLRGVALVDQVKSVDWHSRRVEFAERAPRDFVVEVQEKIAILIGVR
jgi:mRNA interferase MazF